VITKVLVSAAITLGAAVAVASPANADPSAYGTLSCSCEQAATVSGGAPVPPADAVDQGIRSGLADLAAPHGAVS
jgi:hypothetical protein